MTVFVIIIILVDEWIQKRSERCTWLKMMLIYLSSFFLNSTLMSFYITRTTLLSYPQRLQISSQLICLCSEYATRKLYSSVLSSMHLQIFGCKQRNLTKKSKSRAILGSLCSIDLQMHLHLFQCGRF